MESKSRRVQTLLGGALVTLGSLLPVNSFAVPVNMATDTLAGCTTPANQILNSSSAVVGCKKLIAGDYGDFHINDASSSNMARIEFVQGSSSRLVLTGATILADVDIPSSFDITFSHLFENTNPGGSIDGQLTLSGGFNLRLPNSTARTVTGVEMGDLCTSSTTTGDCPSILALAPSLSGSIPAGQTSKTFTPAPANEGSIGTGMGSFTYLEGKVTISSLRANEKISALTLTLVSGANLPPVDADCSLGPPPDTQDINIPADGIPDQICAMVTGFALPKFIPIDNTVGDFVDGPAPEPPTQPVIPEPSTVILLGSGMAALWAFRRNTGFSKN